MDDTRGEFPLFLGCEHIGELMILFWYTGASNLAAEFAKIPSFDKKVGMIVNLGVGKPVGRLLH